MKLTLLRPVQHRFDDLLAQLPTIDLDGIAVAAERLTRVDRKYLVPAGELDTILTATARDAVVLEIGGLRSFRYASTYFDTAPLQAFHEAGRSRRRRFKVRTRSYVDTGTHFLEVKTRGPRSTTVKTRMPISGPLSGNLRGAEAKFVAMTLRDNGIVGTDAAALRSSLDITYVRTTLGFLGTGDRATIDTDLAWTAPDGARVELPGLAVVETKAGSTPTGFDRELWRVGHRPLRMSKYGTGQLAVHPDLPHLKWHRTLTNPLLALAS